MLSKPKSILADIQEHGIFLPPQNFKVHLHCRCTFFPFLFCMPKTKEELQFLPGRMRRIRKRRGMEGGS